MESRPPLNGQPDSAPCQRDRRTWVSLGVLVAIVAAYAVFQAWHFVPGCREPDTATYLTLAERLANGEPVGVVEKDPFLYQWHSWVENHRRETVPKYAPGYSLLMAIALKLGGEKTAYALNPFLGTLTLIGAYLLFRLWLSRLSSLLATFAMATNALYVFHTNYPLAHAADLFFITWGMLALFKWTEAPRTAWALAAGLLLGYSQLVRPPNALLVLPVLAAAAFMLARPGPAKRQQWLQAAALLVAYAVFPTFHLWYNTTVFGGPLTTGYAFTNEQAAFALSRLPSNALFVVEAMGRLGLGIYLGLGLIGLLMGRDWRQSLLKLLWVGPIALLYMTYYWAPRVNIGGYARFFLGLYPALIGSAFVLVERLSLTVARQRALAAGLCALVFVIYLPTVLENARLAGPRDVQLQEQAADLAEAHLRDGAVIFARSTPGRHLSRGKRFRVYELEAFESGRVRQVFTQIPQARVMLQPAREQRFRQFYARNTDRLGGLLRERVEKFLAEGRPVAFVIPKSRVPEYAEILGTDLTLDRLVQWQFGKQAWGIYEIRPQ